MKHSFPHLTKELVLVSLLFLPVVAFAQTAPLSQRVEAYALDSGQHDSEEATISLAYRTTVEVTGAPWLRLSFSAADLGNNSYLLVTSILDGAQQRLDAAALAQWQNTSAYFNGEALELRLYVAPADVDVFVRMDEIIVGEHGAPESQCGPVDNRAPSSDARAGRLLTIGCSAWLIADGRFISAGHCVTSAGSTNTVQFNVPPSLPNGTLQHPGPEDQYTVDDATRVFTDGGVGNDWGVFETFSNTQTGMTALQAQGASYDLVQDLGPPTIRITGYGVDSGTANQTQQTHAGPNAGSSGTTMRYQTDTQGGNSGSPVIDDATGDAVGVHTHGGCSTTGGGNNSGTSTFHSAFWAEVGGATGAGLEVTCTPANPPITIPAGGGSYDYTIDIVNNGGSTAFFDIWFDIEGPGLNLTKGPFSRTLASGASFSRTLTQRVRANAAPGAYTHTCSAGTFPTADDSAAFAWTKSLFGTGGLVSSWSSDAEIAAAIGAGVEASSASSSSPETSELLGAYPNPFNPTSTITYALANRGPIELSVYNTLGQQVAVLASGVQDAGHHEVQFDASSLPSGVYVYTLRAEARLLTGRLLLVK